MTYSFIWDMDGTLVDSYPAIVPATQQACHEYGLNFSSEYIHEAVIRTSVGTFLEQECRKHGLDPAPVKTRFNQLNDSHIDAIRTIPHADETLRLLQSELSLTLMKRSGFSPSPVTNALYIPIAVHHAMLFWSRQVCFHILLKL